MSRTAWRVERRRAFLFLLACGLLWIPRTAEAQSATRIPRIGFLATPTAELIKGRVAAFEQALHELGYVDGKGIIIEYRFADGKFERLPNLATELSGRGLLPASPDRAATSQGSPTSTSAW
jgi:putative ABC transport system substrate-binding protein